jgi:hypothetical protein
MNQWRYLTEQPTVDCSLNQANCSLNQANCSLNQTKCSLNQACQSFVDGAPLPKITVVSNLTIRSQAWIGRHVIK